MVTPVLKSIFFYCVIHAFCSDEVLYYAQTQHTPNLHFGIEDSSVSIRLNHMKWIILFKYPWATEMAISYGSTQYIPENLSTELIWIKVGS
jgi:hypothetical protein